MSTVDEVLSAAGARAGALAAADAHALRDLLHPSYRWTSHRGEVFDRTAYIEANTAGSLTWHSQSLSAPEVVLTGDTAVLTAEVVDVVDRDGTVHTYRMRVTQTWVRTGGAWRCLAGHAGPLLDSST